MEEEEKGNWGNGIGLEEGLESWVCFRIKEEKGLRALVVVVVVVVLLMADWRRSVRERDLSELAFNMFIFSFSFSSSFLVSGVLGITSTSTVY